MHKKTTKKVNKYAGFCVSLIKFETILKTVKMQL